MTDWRDRVARAWNAGESGYRVRVLGQEPLPGHSVPDLEKLAKANGWEHGTGPGPQLVKGEPRELHCVICDRDYPTWYAPNHLWNRVCRLPDGSDRWPFLCPTCFAMKAIAAGVDAVFVLKEAPVILDGQTFEDGVVCGCRCDCQRPLNQGNVMKEDVTYDQLKPWEIPDPDGPRVHLLLCSECYVGNHKRNA